MNQRMMSSNRPAHTRPTATPADHTPGLTAEDAADIRLSRSGDGEAFARLIRRYEDMIGRQMWRFSRDPAIHEQLVQDVFVAAFRGLNGFRGEAPFEHWLRGIAVRTGFAYWRTRKRDRLKTTADAGIVMDAIRTGRSPESEVDAADMVHWLLNQLNPADRLVMSLMYLDELDIGAISELTGFSRTAIKVRAWRAKGKMRRLLQ